MFNPAIMGFYYSIILISIISTIVFSMTTTSLAVLEKRKYLYISISATLFNIIYYVLLDIYLNYYTQFDRFPNIEVEYLLIIILMPAIISLLVFMAYIITSRINLVEQLKHYLITTVIIFFLYIFLSSKWFDFISLLSFLIILTILLLTIVILIILIRKKKLLFLKQQKEKGLD